MSCSNRPGIDFADDYCDEPCEWWEERTVTARKPQRCTECGAPIEKGERYELAKGIIRGEGFHSWKRCMVCVALQEMIANELKICVPFGALAAFCEDERDNGNEAPFLDFKRWHNEHRSKTSSSAAEKAIT